MHLNIGKKDIPICTQKIRYIWEKVGESTVQLQFSGRSLTVSQKGDMAKSDVGRKEIIGPKAYGWDAVVQYIDS
ncbi:MAG: hypothetical protein ACI9BD_000666 [Candidatus Marinamargulisbacteria bacterium]|jgi:hypothetical protein